MLYLPLKWFDFTKVLVWNMLTLKKYRKSQSIDIYHKLYLSINPLKRFAKMNASFKKSQFFVRLQQHIDTIHFAVF